MKEPDAKQAADYARLVARDLEKDARRGPTGELEILEGVLEVTVDRTGKIEVVVTLGGPRAELVLCDGPPRVEVWWGTGHAIESVALSDRFVKTFLSKFEAFRFSLPYEIPYTTR